MSIRVCPLCKIEGYTSVIDSRQASDGTACYRRYKCRSCKQRFTSYEVYFEQPTIGRSKRSNLGRLAAARILDGAVEELNFNGE
jgi:transcriptional regulator NrdR family protein